MLLHVCAVWTRKILGDRFAEVPVVKHIRMECEINT
jgi:hypothetical protein